MNGSDAGSAVKKFLVRSPHEHGSAGLWIVMLSVTQNTYYKLANLKEISETLLSTGFAPAMT